MLDLHNINLKSYAAKLAYLDDLADSKTKTRHEKKYLSLKNLFFNDESFYIKQKNGFHNSKADRKTTLKKANLDLSGLRDSSRIIFIASQPS